MDISVDHVNDLKKTCHVFLEKEKFTASLNSKIEEFRRSAKIKGFRAGKVKTDFIKKKYGKSIEQEFVSDLLDSSWKKILDEHKFNPVAQPTLDVQGLVEDGFRASITFEIAPSFDTVDLKELKFEHTDVEVKDEDIQRLVNDLLLQHGETETKENSSEVGDVVLADIKKVLVGSEDSDENKEEKMESQSVLLNPDKTLPLIVEKLTGVHANETVNFQHAYPEDWHEKDIAGQTAEFTVDVKEVQTLTPATLEVVAETVFNMTKEDYSEEAALEKVAQAAKQQTADRILLKNKDNVLNALKEAHDFDIPESLKERAEKEGEADSVEERLESLKLGFIVETYTKHFNISVSQEDMMAHINKMAQSFGLTAESLLPILSKNKDFQESIYRELIVDNLVKHILEESTNDKVMISYEDAMK